MFTINIKNYRSFKNQDFEFEKMNILIGENSSGKSSLIKFFLAMKQTFVIPNSNESNFTLTGEYSDLGNYKETIYYHNDELPLEFEFKFKNYDSFFYSYFIGSQKNNVDEKLWRKGIKKFLDVQTTSQTSIKFSINKELYNHKKIKTLIVNDEIGSLEFFFPESDKRSKLHTLFTNSCTIIFKSKKLDKSFTLHDVDYDKEGFLTLMKPSSLRSSIINYHQISEEELSQDEDLQQIINKVFYAIAYLLISQNYIKFYTDKIEYINPVKTSPNRIYLVKDDKQNLHINDIEDLMVFFSRNTTSTKEILTKFIAILNEVGILNDFEIIKDDRLPVKELRVKINDLFSNITDVGYGVSLQLPIILKCFLAEVLPERHGSIIFIEQPEVHLHPKLHAKLIETICKLSKHTTYIIETHSEHIIRKLQILVKENKYKLNPKDVRIHYLTREENVTKVTPHLIDKNGRLNPNFASGFFDNSYLLAKELLD